MIFIFVMALFSPPASAGWLDRFVCEHLIANDPYPFAEEPAENLIQAYRRWRTPDALLELVFRLRAGMLNGSETAAFWAAVNEANKK